MLKKAKQIFRGVCKKILRTANWGKKALAAMLAVVIMAGMLPSMGLTVNAVSNDVTIAVSSIVPPTNIGLVITLTATITGGTSLTGTVTFNNNEVPIGSTTTISSGVATISYTPTTMESLSITADYSGDGNNTSAASGAQTATVSKATPSLSIPIATPTSPQTYPGSVTLSSTLSNYYGTLNGQTVTFYDGATFIGTSTTNDSGVATYTWNTPGATTYSIT